MGRRYYCSRLATLISTVTLADGKMIRAKYWFEALGVLRCGRLQSASIVSGVWERGPLLRVVEPQLIGRRGRTRTCDPLLRRQMLYPPELRARLVSG